MVFIFAGLLKMTNKRSLDFLPQTPPPTKHHVNRESKTMLNQAGQTGEVSPIYAPVFAGLAGRHKVFEQ
jgi:hypothetical protein